MKKLLFTHRNLSLYVVIVVLVGCTPPPQATPAPKTIIANFEYTPPEQAKVKEHDIAFMLIRPDYAPTFSHRSAKVFSDFKEHLGKDFEELLLARGYTIRGPVDRWHDIVYMDKKETDLVMEVEIQIDVSPDAGAIKKYYSSQYETYLYYLEGGISVTGYVNLILKEGFSQEKLYIKKISIEPLQADAKSYLKYYTSAIPTTDVGIHNAIVPLLEKAYGNLLQKAWEHLHPLEIAPLKNEVKKLRELRGY
jgi:hypothetical protein